MSTLSLIIITRNEAANLPRCIESVPCADEIVVVDSDSTDDTVAVARRYTEHVHQIAWEGFGKAKQTALAKATGDWVLSLDADEVLDPKLAEQVEHVVRKASHPAAGYRLIRISNFLGRWIRHSGWYPDPVLRLARRELAAFTDAEVHEELRVRGPVKSLHGRLLHYTDPDWPHYLAKLRRYAEISAHALAKNGRRTTLWDLTVRPCYQFVLMYLFRLGFLDGVPGLLLAGGSAFHVFSKYAILWQLNREAP